MSYFTTYSHGMAAYHYEYLIFNVESYEFNNNIPRPPHRPCFINMVASENCSGGFADSYCTKYFSTSNPFPSKYSIFNFNTYVYKLNTYELIAYNYSEIQDCTLPCLPSVFKQLTVYVEKRYAIYITRNIIWYILSTSSATSFTQLSDFLDTLGGGHTTSRYESVHSVPSRRRIKQRVNNLHINSYILYAMISFHFNNAMIHLYCRSNGQTAVGVEIVYPGCRHIYEKRYCCRKRTTYEILKDIHGPFTEDVLLPYRPSMTYSYVTPLYGYYTMSELIELDDISTVEQRIFRSDSVCSTSTLKRKDV